MHIKQKYYWNRGVSPSSQFPLEGKTMAVFDESGRRTVEVNPRSVFRAFGFLILGLLIVILIFSSIARVESGHVGVLTLFGRVTGEVLPEGIHMVNPFKANHEMSIRTQEIK